LFLIAFVVVSVPLTQASLNCERPLTQASLNCERPLTQASLNCERPLTQASLNNYNTRAYYFYQHLSELTDKDKNYAIIKTYVFAQHFKPVQHSQTMPAI
jgi:hypothetical protein